MSEMHDAPARAQGEHPWPEAAGAAASEAEPLAARRPWHGRMLEDAAVELAAFPPGGRVFAIASAGCTAMALARRGDRVTAVDVHPGQVELVRRRVRGDTVPEARTERWLAEGRRRLIDSGAWDERAIATFLSEIDVDVQRRWWDERIATPRLRAMLRAALARPRLVGDRAGFPAGSTPERFGGLVERRLARCVATHPNRWNPYLWWLLAGRDAPGTRSGRAIPESRVDVHVAEAGQWLEAHPRARFDAFTLSDVLDGASPVQRRRLVAAVRRAAEPGAVVVVRSLADDDDPVACARAARDRSGIWGSVRVVKVSRFDA